MESIKPKEKVAVQRLSSIEETKSPMMPKQNSGNSNQDLRRTAGVSAEVLPATDSCDGEPYLLSLKRWKKIANDYVRKDGEFDISKLPEVLDNIKFDLLHNPELSSEFRMKLLSKSQQLCRIIVPMEYGITNKDKIECGRRIIKPLLDKIHHDLLWWKEPQQKMQKAKFEEAEREWDKTGLDETGLGDRVRSYWRHVRTRLYFTSASHIYALLNTLKLGVDSILIDETDKEI